MRAPQVRAWRSQASLVEERSRLDVRGDVTACCQREGADVGRRVVEGPWPVMRLLVKVKGQVTVKVILLVLLEVKVKVVVKAFVEEEFVVEEVLLFSLSSAPNTDHTPTSTACSALLGLGR